MDRLGVGGRGQGKVSLVLELQNELGQEGGVKVKLLAGWCACGSRLAPFGENATGQERVGAAIVGHHPEAGRQRPVYAHTQQTDAARYEVTEIPEAFVFSRPGVDARPTDGRKA